MQTAKKRGLAKVKELFWYSDSEPNEVLIACCHILCLPLALLMEFENPNPLFILGAMASGLFQMWAVVWNGTLQYRLWAVEIATIVSIMTVINLSMAGLMTGSRTGWIVIMGFAAWNTVRVFKEKLERGM